MPNRSLPVVLASGALVVLLGMGIRQAFGVFLPAVSAELGVGRDVFSFAIALQVLLFGLAQPFVGALADRFGAGRVVAAGGALYALGLLLAAASGGGTGLTLALGGIVGVALSGVTTVVVLGVVGRTVDPARRGAAFGFITAAASFGMFVMAPVAQGLLAAFGWRGAFVALAAAAALISLLALGLAGRPDQSAHDGEPELPLGRVLGVAGRQRGYALLTMGFFVCGFHVAFISTHLPAYLGDLGLGGAVSAWALALIGLFNIFGSYLFGRLGDRWSKPRLLSLLYASRAVVIALFVLLPATPVTALAFGAVIGFLWLGTVPLTSGLVAAMFGTRYLTTLFGIVFLGHQVGGFLGAWLGGLAFDQLGGYAPVWWAAVALGVLATLVHLPIDGRRVAIAPAGD